MKKKHLDLLKIVGVLAIVLVLSPISCIVIENHGTNKIEDKLEESSFIVKSNIEALTTVNETMQRIVAAIEENSKMISNADSEIMASKAEVVELKSYIKEVDARLDELASFVFPAAKDVESTKVAKKIEEENNEASEEVNSADEIIDYEIDETSNNVDIDNEVPAETVIKKRNPIQKLFYGIKNFFSKIF